MTRSDSVHTTAMPSAHEGTAGRVNDSRRDPAIDVLTVGTPRQAYNLDGDIAFLGRRLARAHADINALDEMAVAHSPSSAAPNEEVHGDAEKLRRRREEQSDALIEAASYGRAASLADVLTQAIIAFQAAEYLGSNKLKPRQIEAAASRIERIAFSIIAYAAAAGSLNPNDYGARYLAPARLDRLAPSFLVAEVQRLIGERVIDPTGGTGNSVVAADAAHADGSRVLQLIAVHRNAESAWRDASGIPDWIKRNEPGASPDRIAQAEADLVAAEIAETEAFNALFSERPSSTADLLALLRHVQRHVEDSTGNEGSIGLRDVVTAIGDAVEGLRSATRATLTASSPDAFLLDLSPALLPLLDEADAEWGRARALYRQAEQAVGDVPARDASAATWAAWQARNSEAQDASGYSTAWDAIRPLFERIETMVGPYMDVPAQTLPGLLLKCRIGRTLEHFENDAAADLAKIAQAQFGYAKREARS